MGPTPGSPTFNLPLRPPYGCNNPQEMTNNILKSNVDPQMHALTLKSRLHLQLVYKDKVLVGLDNKYTQG